VPEVRSVLRGECSRKNRRSFFACSMLGSSWASVGCYKGNLPSSFLLALFLFCQVFGLILSHNYIFLFVHPYKKYYEYCSYYCTTLWNYLYLFMKFSPFFKLNNYIGQFGHAVPAILHFPLQCGDKEKGAPQHMRFWFQGNRRNGGLFSRFWKKKKKEIEQDMKERGGKDVGSLIHF
jgi:hypothetical protein